MKILRSKKFLTVFAMLLMVAMVVGMGTMTYARYVASANMTSPETATVAQWGYVLTIDTSKMFGQKYEDNVVTSEADNNALDVKANAKVVAPGSSGSMTITLSGNAEVLAKITFAVAEGSKDVVLTYTDNGAEKTYNPIKWTLTKQVGGNAATTVGTANTTLANVINSLKNESQTVPAGQDVPNTVYTISWVWAIGSEALNDGNNMLDTALGMLAANTAAADKGVAAIAAATGLNVDVSKSVLGLSFQLSASVMQIQD